MTRGERNRNLGNIKWNANIKWHGQVAEDPDGFVIFDQMDHGMRAAAKIIVNYYKLHGLNSVKAIISRWSSTDQEAYIKFVAALMFVDAEDPIDITEHAVLTRLLDAIVRFENGHDSTVDMAAIISGVDMALGVTEA